MSRIGKKPVLIPKDVDVVIDGRTVGITGKHGALELTCHSNLTVEYCDATTSLIVSRPNDMRQNRALHGLTRSLLNNMVVGVAAPFEKRLEIHGVGYNATLAAGTLSLQVGFANTVVLKVPEGVTCEVPDATHIVVRSADKQKVGQFAAEIRRVRPPEPYKGKGIRYTGEHVRRKAGKAFGAK